MPFRLHFCAGLGAWRNEPFGPISFRRLNNEAWKHLIPIDLVPQTYKNDSADGGAVT